MANIKSAQKRAKQTVVRNQRNTAQRSLTTELGTLPATLVRFLYGHG